MASLMGIALIVAAITAAALWAMKVPLKHLVVLMTFTISALLPLAYYSVGEPPTKEEASTPLLEQSMVKWQDALKSDPNQEELWYQLGQGYLAQQDFESALTCFDYSLRLSREPSANHMAAKATALYYLHSQSMTDEVEYWIQASLAIDNSHPATLNLMANDHYISLRFEQAAEIWFKMLDSGRTDFDRASVIEAMERAQSMSG